MSGRLKKRVFLRYLVSWLRPYIAELVIRDVIPERIGKYRVLDMLIVLEEKNE